MNDQNDFLGGNDQEDQELSNRYNENEANRAMTDAENQRRVLDTLRNFMIPDVANKIHSDEGTEGLEFFPNGIFPRYDAGGDVIGYYCVVNGNEVECDSSGNEPIVILDRYNSTGTEVIGHYTVVDGEEIDCDESGVAIEEEDEDEGGYYEEPGDLEEEGDLYEYEDDDDEYDESDEPVVEFVAPEFTPVIGRYQSFDRNELEEALKNSTNWMIQNREKFSVYSVVKHVRKLFPTKNVPYSDYWRDLAINTVMNITSHMDQRYDKFEDFDGQMTPVETNTFFVNGFPEEPEDDPQMSPEYNPWEGMDRSEINEVLGYKHVDPTTGKPVPQRAANLEFTEKFVREDGDEEVGFIQNLMRWFGKGK